MMLYKNPKVKVFSPDGNTDYFDIVAGVFIIYLDFMLRASIDKMKDNGFKLAKEKKQKIPLTNNYERGLRQWHSTSGKYTRPSRNPAS